MRALSFCLLATLPLFAAEPVAHFAAVQKLSGSVGFYDAAGKHLGDAKVGQHPHEATLSVDGKTLYASDNGVVWMTDNGDGENTISIVDIATRKRTGVVDLGSFHRPHGITVVPGTGNLLVTTEKPNALLLVDPVAKKVIRSWDVKGKAPHMVVLNSTGEWAFTSDSNSGELSVINIKTNDVKVVAAGKRPQGQAFSPDGRVLYVTLADDAAIAIFDLAKMAFTGRVAVGKTPVRVAVTPDGKTLVYALQEANSVGFADVATRRQVAEVNCGGPTMSMSLSRDGKMAYTGIQEQDKLVEISVADRKITRAFNAPKGSGPDPVLVLR